MPPVLHASRPSSVSGFSECRVSASSTTLSLLPVSPVGPGVRLVNTMYGCRTGFWGFNDHGVDVAVITMPNITPSPGLPQFKTLQYQNLLLLREQAKERAGSRMDDAVGDATGRRAARP